MPLSRLRRIGLETRQNRCSGKRGTGLESKIPIFDTPTAQYG